MKHCDFIRALEIIGSSHSIELIINQIPPNTLVSEVLDSPTISIKSCPPVIIDRLKEGGFMLGMDAGLMTVRKKFTSKK